MGAIGTWTIRHLCMVGLALLLLATHARGAQQAISLAGTWGFRMDREDRGVQEKWFAAALPEKIALPGSMAEQGFGDDVSIDTKWTGQIVDRSWFTEARYEPFRQAGAVKVPFWLTPVKCYVGPAWYQRQIKIPSSWRGKRIVLFLERPHWETRVWVDDREIGSQNSLSTPHEFDLSDLAPGEHRLTLCVDNRVKINVGDNAHSVSDHTQTNWNGVVGRIELRATDRVWVEDVQVYPDVKGRTIHVRATIGNSTQQPVEGVLRVAASSFNAEKRHHVGAREAARFTAAGARTVVEFDFALGEDALLWSEFSPALYKLTVSLTAAASGTKYAHETQTTFGLREFAAKGTRFTMNGAPVFLRGTLECAIFPRTGYPPTDVESWLRVLKIAKAHGLNHLRFHSWCPPEAAFVAGDQMGFIFRVEGSTWTTVGENPTTDAFIRAEAERIFRTYGNHPSFCLYTHGNEPAGKNQKEFLGELVTEWKQVDSRRLYTSGAGWPTIPENDFHCTPTPRTHQWGEGLRSRLNAKAPETTADYSEFIGQYKVPVVSHEIGQWCVYPNFDEIRKYAGVTRAYNFEIFRESLAQNHMLDQAHDFLMASGKLQALCYKEEIESALRTKGMGGFALLDLHDFPGQGTALVGILDPFWDSKGYITAAEHRRFCSETVPLARMVRRVWTTDQTFEAEIEVAHFGPAPIKDARPEWSIATVGGKVLASGELPCNTISRGNGFKLGRVALHLGRVPAPAKLVLTVGLKGTPYSNDWDVWVYPQTAPVAAADDVLIADRFDEAVSAALSAGKKVLLMPPPGTVTGDRYGRVRPGMTPIFWNTAWTGRQEPHTLGILCDPKHPALAQFPTEYHSNWQWWELLSRSQAAILNDFPTDLRPIVQVIDDWVTNRRLGLVFEAKVAAGKLLFCSIDLRNDLESRPVARQLRYSLLKYMASPAFDPQGSVEAARIRGLLAPMTTLQELNAKVIKADSEVPNYEAANAIDGSAATIWHTPWEDKAPGYPHEIQIDLQKSVEFKGFRYVPRQDVHNGWAREYAFYVSEDGQQWGEPVAKGTFPRDEREKQVMFNQPRKARYVRFVAVSGHDGKPYATLAEMDLIFK